MMKKICAILLTLIILVTMLPLGTVVYAAEEKQGEGLIPDQEVSGPCDEPHTFEINVTELAVANGHNLNSIDQISIDPNIGIVEKTVNIGVGYEKKKIQLVCRTFDEPCSEYVRVDVTVNGRSTYFYVHVVLTGKYRVNISGVTAANAIYDGSPKTGYSGTPEYKLTSGEPYIGNDIEVTYTDAEGRPLPEAPTEIGDYYVTFAVPETNETYKGSLTLPFKILDNAEASYQAEENGEWINTSFIEAVANVYEGGTVKLLRDISIDGSTVSLDKNMTIISADSTTPCVITTKTDGHSYLFRIGADVKLENVIADGGSASGITASRALIAVGDTEDGTGKLTLGNGAVVRNNNNTTKTGSGGGICVISGECIIDGGRITGNSANSGGGISMTGTDNLSASFLSGSIDNNKATGVNYGYGYGGGVYINGGSFTMSDGNIYDNQALGNYGYGGGVMLRSGNFTMTKGNIYDNTAARLGGAVYAANATMKLQNGTITGNHAAYGGAMYINPSVTLELTGGSITKNTATTYAGGIELAPEATIKISGAPVVEGNTSSEETDGGMYFDYDGSGNREPPVITIGGMTTGASLHWYTWMQNNLDRLGGKLQIAAPAEGNDAITAYDLSKMHYIDEDYDLILDGGDMYLVERIPATGITVTPETLEMKVGKNETLTAALSPENSTCPITWSSSDTSVATVDNGVVTAIKPGVVTITATVPGDISDSCVVTVIAEHTVTYSLNGGTPAGGVDYSTETVIAGTEITVKTAPARDGYSFIGWSDGEKTYKPGDKIVVDSNITLTAQWEKDETSEVPDVLIDEHYAYIIGYTDGLVHPEANITRAEAATVFFRLLDEEAYEQYLTSENSFPDVKEGSWYNTAVSTMAKMGLVIGRPDGSFDPNAYITRAEFATIVARIDPSGSTTGAAFTDISGHWAQEEINIAANNGWVQGYEDGTFRPDQNITRAEVMTLMNRVLQRLPDSPEDLLPGMVTWPDNMDTTKWYYLAVQEATNSHNYSRDTSGGEYWTGLRDVPDWSAWEK